MKRTLAAIAPFALLWYLVWSTIYTLTAGRYVWASVTATGALIQFANITRDDLT